MTWASSYEILTTSKQQTKRIYIMAYFSQDQKKAIAPLIKALCKKHNVKATLSVTDMRTVCLNIKSSPFDFFEEAHESAVARQYLQLSQYSTITGKGSKFFNEAISILQTGNYNNSDVQTDYFDVGHYVRVNVGAWNKPHVMTD